MAAVITSYVENFGPFNKAYWGTGPPTTKADGDTFQAGDIIWNTAPAGSGPAFWMCTVTAVKGTDAGTWKASANLAA